ncbi:MAG: AbrB/MazE/SpoVT family DNA-binding domain-containing protein [Treponema sp.]|nr:AbrB/MazE/SpoVT family DNA-binding domain-containing protein [Treponema sp.]MCL2272237.1 AbrB/MazE/SpoVT family DNA-binding domain-containing protein [Treponema sp.]
MQTTIVKWGNSHGVRLPKVFLQNIKISENDPVDITLDNEKIIIKKINHDGHKTIRQRLFDFYGENFEQFSALQNEIDWGKPAGNEIW